MANALMFEVGIKDATDGLKAIEKKLDGFVSKYEERLKIKVQIDQLDTFINALKTVGSGEQLKPLLEQVERLQNRLAAMGDKGTYLDMLRADAKAAEAEFKAASEAYEKFRKFGTGNTNISERYKRDRDEAQVRSIRAAEQLASAEARFAQEEQKVAVVTQAAVSATQQNQNALKEEANTAQDAVNKLNNLVVEKQKVVSAEKNLANSSKSSEQALKQEGDSASKTAQNVESLGKAQKNAADASKQAGKEQANAAENLGIKYATLIQRIENWQANLSKLLAGGGSKYYGTQLNDAIEAYGRVLKSAELGSAFDESGAHMKTLRALLQLLGVEFANVNKEAAAFNREQKRASNSAWKSHLRENAESLKQQANAIKQADKENQKWASSMDLAKTKANELQNTISKLEAHRLVGSSWGQDTSALSEQIDKLKSNLSTLYGMIGGTKMNGTAQDFVKSSVFKVPLENAKAAQQVIQQNVRDEKAYLKEVQRAYEQSAKAQAAADKQAERDMQRRLKAADALDNKMSRLNARKLVDYAGLDTSKLEAAVNKIRAIRDELSNFARTGTSAFGNSPKEIMQTMGLEVANREAAMAMKALNQEKAKGASATAQLTSEEHKLAQAIGSSTREMRNQGQILSDLKQMALQYLSLWGAQSFLNNIIKIGGQLEQQRLSIGAILGDMAAGQHLFEQIKSLALTSPFGVMELDKDTKQLAAYGFKQSELFDMTKRLADISAGAGTEVSRLALALGHVRSEGALSGYTLRQFAMNNIPMLGKLSERLTEIEGKIVSTQEIRKRISRKEIGYDDVIAVIKDLTNEGGMFFQMQETMAEAVNAKFKNLRDSLDIMYSEIAESKVGDVLKKTAEALMVLSRNWDTTARFLGYGAVAWLTYKAAVIGANTGLTRLGVTEARSTMMLNAKKIALGLTSASVKKLTADEVNEMVTLKLLTKEQLISAVATGKLRFSQAELAATTLNVSRTQLFAAASMGRYGLVMSGISMRMRSLVLSIRGIGAALKSAFLNPVGIAIMGVTALFEWFMRWKQKNDEIKESISNLEKKSTEGYRNLSDTLSKFSNIGNMDEAGYVSAINDIVDALKNYAPDINNILKQAYAIDDLGKRYKYLREELEKTKEAYSNLEKVAGTAVYAAENSDLSDQVEDYIESLKKTSKAESEFYQNRAAIEKALDKLGKLAGFSKVRKNDDGSLKNISEQMALVRGNGGWAKLFSGYLYTESLKAASAWNAFNGKLKESEQLMRENVEPAVSDFADRINNDYIGKFGENWKKDSANIKTAWIEIKEEIDKIPGMTDKVRNELLDKIFNKKWNMGIDFNTGETMETLTGWRKEMQDYFDEHKILLKVGVNDSPDEIEKRLKGIKDEAQSAVDRYGKILIGIGLKLDNLPSGLPSPLATPWNMNALENYPVQKAIADEVEEAAKHFKLNIEGKKKKEGGTGSREDKEAKTLRERVRILKEAADAYQYWRKSVGESSAFSHVNSEFGGILGEQGFKIEDAQKLENTLTTLRDKYLGIYESTGKKRPQLLEAIKEIDKELANLQRKDFERQTEEFVSQMTRELDELSRSFEIFNSVRESTGDALLAERLTGIRPGATPADLKKYNIATFAGVNIDFDSILKKSDDEIDRYVEALGVTEEKIKAIQNGLKDWKKAQQDVAKSDILSYAKWIGSLVDLQSMRNRNQEEYNRILEETNRLLSNGLITEEEAERRRQSAKTSKENKDWQETAMYSRLYGNAQMMAEGEFYEAYNKESAILFDLYKAGTIKIGEYADKMAKLNKIAAEFRSDGFLGLKGGVGAYLSGGYQGLINYHWNKAADLRKQGNDEEADKEEKRAESMEKAQKATEQLIKAFQDLSTGVDMLGNLFDALGWEGGANAMADAGSLLSGAASGASSLSAFGPWGAAAGAALGFATSLFQLNDKSIQREIDALKENNDALEANTTAIKTARERTLGYDSGTLRKQMASLYANTLTTKTINSLFGEKTLTVDSAARKAMGEYYSRNSSGTGYKQELENLKAERENYQKMYDLEYDKKKSSNDALNEYRDKMAELDDQIANYIQDLTNELWGIDFKSWADQISDALWTAFENGEDAVKAFRDTAKDIIADVAKKMMNLHFIEPAFEQLEEALFGKLDSNGNRIGGAAYNTATGQLNEEETLRILGEFLGEGGYMEKQIEAAQAFYELAQKASGIDFSSDEKKSSTGNSIKSITEQTADLLASYVNAIRADVSVDRAMVAEYYPQFLRAMTRGNDSLTNIETNTAAIMRSSEKIMSSNNEILSIFKRVTQGGDKVRI